MLQHVRSSSELPFHSGMEGDDSRKHGSGTTARGEEVEVGGGGGMYTRVHICIRDSMVADNSGWISRNCWKVSKLTSSCFICDQWSHIVSFYRISTPLIKLCALSEETGCTIAVKAENLNPGGSVKDRAALYLIKDAEERGEEGGRKMWEGRRRRDVGRRGERGRDGRREGEREVTVIRWREL